jgi:hypothetical protein
MDIVVTEDVMNERKAVDVRIEEVADVSFDLSESDGYVDIDEVSGRLLVEYGINHGAVRDELKRVRDPSVVERIITSVNGFLENWSPSSVNPGTLRIDYGTLLMRGTDPINGVPNNMDLVVEISTSEFETTSPEDLKRDLRQEQEYTLTYRDLEADIKAYLSREGINTDQVSLGSPVHIQARAEPIADDEQEIYGTKLTVAVENRAPRRIDKSKLEVSMPGRIGRELVLLGSTTGTYDAAGSVYVFDVPSISSAPGQETVTHELEFVVPQSVGQDLEVVEGSAELNTRQPFSNYLPEAIFDAGGRKLYDHDASTGDVYANVQTTCSIRADFYTPTSDIMIGETAVVERKITIDGVTPPQAEGTIESILAQRGIDTSGGVSKTGTELRESAEVTKFNGEFTGGSVIVNDARINIEVSVTGERRTGEAETGRSGGEELPAKQRNVSIDYGQTGVTIRGRGADTQKVDSYVGDLRDEIRLSLNSMAEEV